MSTFALIKIQKKHFKLKLSPLFRVLPHKASVNLILKMAVDQVANWWNYVRRISLQLYPRQ